MGGPLARELVVLAKPAQITVITGVTTQALPAGYEDYENYEIIVVAAQVVVDVLRGPTSWLFAQIDSNNSRLGVDDNAEDGNEQWLTWTPSTRTLGVGGQNSVSLRIQSVRLYDSGRQGEKGDRGDVGPAGGPPGLKGDPGAAGQPGAPGQPASLSSTQQARLAGITVNNETAARVAADDALRASIPAARNVLLAWDRMRTTTSYILPANFRDWAFLTMVRIAGVHEMVDGRLPTAALGAINEVYGISGLSSSSVEAGIALAWTANERKIQAKQSGLDRAGNASIAYLALEN